MATCQSVRPWLDTMQPQFERRPADAWGQDGVRAAHGGPSDRLHSPFSRRSRVTQAGKPSPYTPQVPPYPMVTLSPSTMTGTSRPPLV